MRQVRGWGDVLKVWDGHAVKFGCNDCCTPINVIKFITKKIIMRSSHCGTAETNPTRNHEVSGSISGLVEWVQDPVLLWLWCRSQTWLGSGVAVALA